MTRARVLSLYDAALASARPWGSEAEMREAIHTALLEAAAKRSNMYESIDVAGIAARIALALRGKERRGGAGRRLRQTSWMSNTFAQGYERFHSDGTGRLFDDERTGRDRRAKEATDA